MKILPSLLVSLSLAASNLAEEIVTLPGTAPLTWTGDLSAKMHEAALSDMDQRISAAVKARPQLWHGDLSSPAGYEKSITAHREHFKRVLGLVDRRVPVTMERYGDDDNPALVAQTEKYRVWQVRWPVLDGVWGEGLLLLPKGAATGMAVAIPDADQSPEQIAGLAPGVAPESQFARRLVENGFEVVVPVLIGRTDAGSGNPAVAMTNEPQREWIYRQAYMMGRHIIGYELEKVLAAVDWLETTRGQHDVSSNARVGVVGYGEGGLLAFYAGAIDPRIQATLVSGYFKPRERTFEEPLYRNVWGLLREFGDAEIASMVAPRGLVVEYSAEPSVAGPPPVHTGDRNCGAPGRLETPSLADVQREFQRIETFAPSSFQSRKLIAGEKGAVVPMASHDAVAAFAGMLGNTGTMAISASAPADVRRKFEPAARQLHQMKELEAHVQGLVQISHRVRDDFFLHKIVPEYNAEKWTLALRFPPLDPQPAIAAARPYRDDFWENILGKITDPLPAPNPRTRKIYDEPKWTGYEVVVDVGGEGFAWGILCVPKDIKPGEKRPVVVCQHGRHGLPQEVVTENTPAYRNFAARLAEQGFVTFAPHNLYQKETYYRTLSRHGNTVGLSMFSVILRHHEQWLNWLQSLPFVDGQRIGFYGLSYGGESAVRIPPLLDGYALSICSGDFNDWPLKVASTDDRHSFMFTDEWEMPYFNMGNTFSYAELTYLMFPRPCMVERGHHDQVAPDSWVASEYARTRWFYDQFGLGDRTRIEFFNGGHTINGEGTFEFLHEQLRWPPQAEARAH